MSAPVGLVLASASPARAATLRSAGVDPHISPTNVDEDATLASLPADSSPAHQVSALARAKAQAWDPQLAPEGWGRFLVVGCDSMLQFGEEMLGKPHVPEVAAQRIRQLSGQDAVLWSGHHVQLWEGGELVGEATGAEPTTVHFDTLSDAEIDAYVSTGEPLEVAGSFTIDGLGGPFIRGVTGDPHSVVGISLPLLRHLAADLGVFWPDLWDGSRP